MIPSPSESLDYEKRFNLMETKMEANFKELTKKINAQGGIITEQGKVIKDLGEIINGRDKEIHKKDKEIHKKDTAIKELKKATKDQQRKIKYQDMVNQKLREEQSVIEEEQVAFIKANESLQKRNEKIVNLYEERIDVLKRDQLNLAYYEKVTLYEKRARSCMDFGSTAISDFLCKKLRPNQYRRNVERYAMSTITRTAKIRDKIENLMFPEEDVSPDVETGIEASDGEVEKLMLPEEDVSPDAETSIEALDDEVEKIIFEENELPPDIKNYIISEEKKSFPEIDIDNMTSQKVIDLPEKFQ